MITWLLIGCGLLTGIVSGMLGVGGGVVVVPTLYFLFRYTGLFEDHVMQVAASTSLAISFFISLLSSIVQHSKRAILFSALKFMAPGLVVGCIAGVLLAHVISSELIRHIFGVGALLLGIYFAIPRLPHLNIASSPNRSLSLFGVVIGALSSLLGVGGGIFTFPTFLGYGMDTRTSSATSSCTTALSTFMGTMAYLFIAPSGPQLPSVVGFIDIHAFMAIGIAALLTTPLGVWLSHTISTHLAKRIFGVCLSLIGLAMLLLH